MLSVEEALTKILDEIEVLGEESVGILDSRGQVLAQDIVSNINVPPHNNSAMDGFAVIAADTAGASETNPVILKVTGTVIAGDVAQKAVVPGTAIRIMTGAPVPPGADAVVQFEHTDEEKRKQNNNKPDSAIGILVEAKQELNIRKAGESICKGTLALRKGTVIRPAEIGVMASLGYPEARVIRRPVVAILSTGNELTELGQPLPEGKIYDSNLYSIASLVREYGCIPRILGIARDEEPAIMEKLEQARDADILLTTGGVSMGDYDMVKDILDRDGKILFWKVRVKPGKPLAFGRIKSRNGKSVPHMGLPGNAVSCMVSFELFVRPALMKMMGKTNLSKPFVEAITEDALANTSGRRLYDRAIVKRRNGDYYARLTGPQGSGILTSMSSANALVIIPEEMKQIEKGNKVQALMLDWNEAFNLDS